MFEAVGSTTHPAKAEDEQVVVSIYVVAVVLAFFCVLFCCAVRCLKYRARPRNEDEEHVLNNMIPMVPLDSRRTNNYNFNETTFV